MPELFSDDVIVDPDKDYLAELVGEGKKFADAKALARAKAESDAFISRLEQENAGLREEVTKRLSLEDAVRKITEKRPTTDLPEGDTEGNADRVSKEQIAELVSQKVNEALSQTTAKQSKEKNLEEVVTKLREKFGDNFQRTVEAKRQQLGLGKDFLAGLAETQPKAFLALVGATETRATETSVLPSEGINTSGLPRESSSERGKKFYDDLRNKNPKEYWSPRVQNEMHAQAKKLGIQRFNSI